MMPGSRVDLHLRQAERWWKWQLLLHRLASLGFVLGGLVLLVGIAMWRGQFQQLVVPASLLLLVVGGGLLVGVVLLVLTFDRRANWPFLASAVEKAHPSLLDRLHTLIYLRFRDDRLAAVIRPQIEHQALQVLEVEPQFCPFSWRPTCIRLLTLAAFLMGVAAFYVYLHPWRFVHSAAVATAASGVDAPLEIPALPADEERPAAAREDWTEVRISQPGHDLQVTQHEVLPLVIEAASTRRLQQLQWLTGVNELPQQTHPLPPPDDPRYFAHESEIMLEDFTLQTWDVLAYFARATTDDDRQYDSPMYFIHLVPDREQLQQLPGGEQGEAYRTLQELTGFIQRQQEVLRQTWQARSPTSDAQGSEERASQLEALAREETQLRDEIEYLTAALRARLEDAPLQDLQQSLQQAQDQLQATQQQLQQRAASEAVPHASQTLSDLVMSRKRFHELVQDHPTAFEPPANRLAADERQEPSADSLREQPTDGAATPAEDGDGVQSPREFVQQALLEQRDIERAASSRSNRPEMARRQLDLQQSLKDFVEQHPDAFEQTRGECQQAQAAMRQTAQSLQANSNQAAQHAQQAAESLQELDSALERQQQRTALVDAHRLQQELEEQVRQLQQLEQEPPATPSSACKAAGNRAKSSAGQVRRLTQQPGPGDALASPLQQALSEGQPERIDTAAERLAGVMQKQDVPPAAQDLRQPLQQLAERLKQALQVHRGEQTSPALLPQGQQAIEQGLRQLDSLTRRQAGDRPLSTDARSQLSQAAQSNLIEGIADTYGHNERTQAVLQRLRRDLDPSAATLDLQTLRELERQIQTLRRETAATTPTPDDPAEMTGLDPTRLPPEYRESIRKYFEQLSRQP